MTASKSYRREIDACRPGSNDLDLPELAELARAVADDPRVAKALEASHASDIALCDGLQDVPVPSGLADRMLAAVEAATKAAQLAASEADGDATVALPPAAAESPAAPSRSRRAWLIAVPALAASLALGLAVVFWQQSEPRRVSQAELASLVETWYQQAQQRQGWTTSIDRATAEQFPVDSSVLLARPVAQRTISAASAGEAVAYELRRADRKAVLLVVRTRDHYDVAPLPSTNRPLGMVTGNKKVAAWQSGSLLYVLVVEANQGSLRDFIRPRDLT